MSVCQDCSEKIEYGRGIGGGGVCPSCRAKRANKSRRVREKASGKATGKRKECDS